MEMDLNPVNYTQESYEEYILGSAEVVGLMCLKVFVHGNEEEYAKLKPYAIKLGSAFQKINFFCFVITVYINFEWLVKT